MDLDTGGTMKRGSRASRPAATALAGLALLLATTACSDHGATTAAPGPSGAVTAVTGGVGTTSGRPVPVDASSSARPHPGSSAGAGSTSPSYSQPPAGQVSLDSTAQRLAPYLEAHFAGYFASVLVDDPHGQLVVFRLPDPHLDATVCAMAGRTRVVFVNARYSYLRQHQLLARIGADRGYWRRHGIVVNSLGATNGVHCAVIVTTNTGSQAQQRAFDARYGAGLVEVSQGGAVLTK